MKFEVKGMTIYVLKDYQEISRKAANLIASHITLKPDSVLGLATGSTPLGMYENLAELCQAKNIDFSEVKSFNLDEYYPISKNNIQSYNYYMHHNFFEKINIKPENINIPNGEATNIEDECKSYDEKIYMGGGIDLQVLGIGNNGHIGFNEPNVHFDSGTHLVELDQETTEANARFFNTIDEVPKRAISMGIRSIMHSKKIILIANGSPKAEVVDKMLFGQIDPNVPASILQLHNDVIIILDEDAAKIILQKLI